MSMKHGIRVIIAALLLTMLLTAPMLSETAPVDAEQAEYTGNALPLEVMAGNPYHIADVAEEASPSIVYIEVEWPRAEAMPPRDPFWDMWDDWFFSPRPRMPRQQRSSGTGFFIDETGIILTNQHVVGNLGDEQTITVIVNSPDIAGEFEAELLGADAKLDLAVLMLTDDSLGPFPVVPLGNSDEARPGEWVIAIGNPYGKQFEHTVTVGVLSAKGREIQVPTREGQIRVYENLMQTDAAINQGNSGGPLLNIQGEVIGINTAVHAQAQGIGFAIPINVARDVLDELIETGRVEHVYPARAWLGVWYLDVTDDIAARLDLPDTKGIIISDVIQGSPAEEAGLRSMDVVRRVEDKDIHSIEDFASAIAEQEPGDAILLNVIRDGRAMFITVTLGDMPAQHRR